MGVGGHEALLVIQVIALGITLSPFVRRLLLQSPQGKLVKTSDTTPSQIGHVRTSTMLVLHLLCVSGMGVWVIDDQLVRLLATAVSCVGFAVLYTLEWGRAWECDQMDRKASSEWIEKNK